MSIAEDLERARVMKLMQDPNAIFVFGSNLAGIHGAGAALTAREHYGAQLGQGLGLYGRSYAIPTKDERLETLPLPQIARYVFAFVRFAWQKPLLQFAVTRVGCGLAGYTDAQISPLFAHAPPNCHLPYGWL